MKFFKSIISILCLAFTIPFTACSKESPFEVAEDEIANASDDVYDAKRKSMCFNDKDEYNSWCCEMFGEKCSVKYSSSSSYVSESEKCRLGTSTYSNSYCCSYYGYQCSYSSSSSRYVSSSSSALYYLTTAKSMKITLTYYKQLSSNWDGLDNAGDDLHLQRRRFRANHKHHHLYRQARYQAMERFRHQILYNQQGDGPD